MWGIGRQAARAPVSVACSFCAAWSIAMVCATASRPSFMVNGNVNRILAVLAVFLVGACSGKPHAVRPQPRGDTMRSHAVYLVSHGWHAGLVVPAREVNQILPDLHARFGDVAFYELGWGDTGFYQSQEITTGLTLHVMFWSEGAVMHVVAVPDSPTHYFAGEEVIDMCLDESDFASLKTFIANSFEQDLAAMSCRLGQESMATVSSMERKDAITC